jgi:uncharacterized membrane protein (DUF373 family)
MIIAKSRLDFILSIGWSNFRLAVIVSFDMSEKQTVEGRAMQTKFGSDEPLLKRLSQVIRLAVQALSVIMVFVIISGVADVIFVLYQRLMTPPFFLLTISDILATFGAFLAVMIAIEIFENLTLYLREDVIHVEIVMATALMAIARKVIVLDFKALSSDYVYATAAVVLAMSIGYWLVVIRKKKELS